MKNKKFFLTLTFSRYDKKIRKVQREIQGRHHGRLFGYNEHVMDKGMEGFRVWIDKHQSPREIVDSFFHEMTHVLVRILRLTEKELSKESEEHLCQWIGYLAKAQFHDRMPKKFCFQKRKIRWKF